VLRVVAVAISIGLADSINPSTVGPALYMATLPRPALRVGQFALGIFVVNLAAGLILIIGPGRLLLGLVPRPQANVRHVIELVAGVILIACAVAVWLGRRRLARHQLPLRSSGGSAIVAGVSIAAVELPTALPYFAVIAAIVASRADLPGELLALLAYNLAFLLPLLTVVLVLLLAGPHAEPWLRRGAAWLERRWPSVLAALLLFVGSILTMIGARALIGL